MKGEWITKWEKTAPTGRKFKAVFKCSACGQIHEKATNYCPDCGDPKNGADQLISKQQTIDQIRRMMDMDGFRDGDAVSRRAVIRIIGAQPDERGTDETDKCR
jgi:predicted ATP-dependent serine protease